MSHAFKTAKIIVFDPMMCKSPDVPLRILLSWLIYNLFSGHGTTSATCVKRMFWMGQLWYSIDLFGDSLRLAPALSMTILMHG